MTPQDRELVAELFDRLASLESAPRDPEAEQVIAEGLRRAPHALYPLVQTVLLQDEALKAADARIRDNDGKQPIDKPVVKDGPAAHFATLPIKACVAEMRKAGLPAAVSNTAGTFVCNHIFYALMDIAQSHPIPMRGGFLHIPYVPEQAARLGGAPSMALDDIVRGIEIILEVSASRVSDVHTVEGRIS